MSRKEAVYIVTAIHCPSCKDMTPHCYTITGAYASPLAAQAAMQAKAKELREAPLTHSHHPAVPRSIEGWKEDPLKIEFRDKHGGVGVCWIEERLLGDEQVPITKHMTAGRLGLGRRDDDGEINDWEVEKTLCSLLKF